MLTKQEQEILDNAPEGATHYLTSNEFGSSYAIYNLGDYDTFDNKSLVSGFVWSMKYDLADLRKKQGKTVVDAVNHFKCELVVGRSAEFVTYDSYANGYGIGSVLSEKKTRVCTIEEFNQCVKEMSEVAGKNAYEAYATHEKTPLEPINPRTKVEYVKVTDSIFNLQPDLDAGEIYLKVGDNDEFNPIKGESTLAYAFEQDKLYRKVETEIKTEKRWIIYNSRGEFCSEHDHEYKPFDKSLQVIEIEVEV